LASLDCPWSIPAGIPAPRCRMSHFGLGCRRYSRRSVSRISPPRTDPEFAVRHVLFGIRPHTVESPASQRLRRVPNKPSPARSGAYAACAAFSCLSVFLTPQQSWGAREAAVRAKLDWAQTRSAHSILNCVLPSSALKVNMAHSVGGGLPMFGVCQSRRGTRSRALASAAIYNVTAHPDRSPRSATRRHPSCRVRQSALRNPGLQSASRDRDRPLPCG
jgi:hypothetical protein